MNVRRIFGLDQREKGRAYLIFFIYINWHSSLQMFFFICCKRLVAAVKQYIVGNIIYIALIALGILILIEAFALACVFGFDASLSKWSLRFG